MKDLLIQTAFRLGSDDLAILDAVKQKMGLVTRADALRYVLRQYSQANGLQPKVKPKTTKPKTTR
ncbi:MAG: hypothetical protein SFV15_16775 [Polyangiaceae bacterium]|nr:hypothetical protein [Polyangiaceae bacterium]